MSNPFAGRVGLSGPANDLEPVTPSDSADLPNMAVALYVTGGGDVSFISAAGEGRVVTVGDGFILPVGARRVLATNTTATGIHAFTVQ
jgi:hypothetical protein